MLSLRMMAQSQKNNGKKTKIKNMSELEKCNEWQKTNYGLNPPVKCPLENGRWYEIGYMNQFGGGFGHQGIRQFNDGFMDDNGYYLKPFPTHFKEIILTEPIS